MATLTIRNLDEDVKRMLRLRAAKNSRSMEAEVRAILAKATAKDAAQEAPATPEVYLRKMAKARAIWKGTMTTDEVMALTRGE